MIAIQAGKIFTPVETITKGTIQVEGSRILKVADTASLPISPTEMLDASGLNVAPGFIDLHTHGAIGSQAIDGTPESLSRLAAFYASHGVTGFLAGVSGMMADIEKGIRGVLAYRQPGIDQQGAGILGIHLEGPFINPTRSGAFRPESILPPSEALFERLVSLCNGELSLITLAPELEGATAVIRAARQHGVVCSAGHSAATWDEMMTAAELGVSHSAHTFNAMRPLQHREPGILGAILADDRFSAEIIADGIHVHPGVVRLLVRAKGPERVALITDSVGACGLPDGRYHFEGEDMVVKDGSARLEDGTLSGSVLTMDRGMANLLAFGAAQSLNEALQMASTTPAKVINLEKHKGQVAPGMDADLVAFDEQFKIHWTMVRGKIVYRSPN